MEPTIYLDYQSTTPLDRNALEAMLPYLSDRFGNAASAQHSKGKEAAEAVEHARGRVAALIGADRREIFFCSGATEANNLALKGVAKRSARRHFVALATEHPAVLDPLQALAKDGCTVELVGVDELGEPDLDALAAAVDDHTVLVSVAAANNEIGALPQLRAISEIAHRHGALLHTDAAQAAGKVALDVERDGIDLLSMSAHKLYGPKGVGALYVRRECQSLVEPLQHGGGHERGMRSGTLDVPGIVGFGAAADVAFTTRDTEPARLRSLARRFLTGLQDQAEGVHLNGPIAPRLPGNVNVRIEGVDTEALIANCPNVCFSAGSACSAATPSPSHVLLAIGLSSEAADESARFGFGRQTTEADVDQAVSIVLEGIAQIRARSQTTVGAA